MATVVEDIMPQYPSRREHVRWRQCLRLLSKIHVEGNHLRGKGVALTVSCCLAPPKNGGKLPARQPCTCLLAESAKHQLPTASASPDIIRARPFVFVHRPVGCQPSISPYQRRCHIFLSLPHQMMDKRVQLHALHVFASRPDEGSTWKRHQNTLTRPVSSLQVPTRGVYTTDGF